MRKFIRYSIGVWSIDTKENNEIVGIAKVECVELDDEQFNDFATKKLEIIKKLIDEL